MIALAASLLLGAVLGVVLRWFGRRRSAECLAMAKWKRRAVYGAVLGLLFHAVSGCTSSSEPPLKNMKQISEADFDAEVTQAKMPVVVDFYAPWCGPCRILSPRLDNLAGEYTGKIKFVQVNVDHAPTLSQKFDVQAIPKLVFFGKDGKPVNSSVGLVSVETLRAKLNELIAK